jgi:alkanesulfonate monooxygenase SsuD/methylene tetrahydromethanopterin reductase-like flavin-dependent oxidoreductase (luciferase family)
MPVDFGLDFFPDMRPSEKSGEQYFAETLRIARECEDLGSTRIKIVEHYFHPYGGYSPNPIVFLSAAAAITKRQRLMTGAVLPVFNHPLKLAGELAMLDCLSNGRVDAGVARAFLPHEFAAFGVSMDDSRGRFEEGIEALKLLWTQENVTFHGRYHSFEGVTSLPRPVQQPHPPIWIAAIATPASFQWAGEQGYSMMVVPYIGDYDELAEHLHLYRSAFAASGSPGRPRVMMVLHCVIDRDRQAAHDRAWAGMQHYLAVFREIASWWAGRDEAQYKKYEMLPTLIDAMTWEKVDREHRAIVGDPLEALDKVQYIVDKFGDCEMSFQVHFGGITPDEAIQSIRWCSEEVNPTVRMPSPLAAAQG